MYQTGKLENIVLETKRMGIDIMGLAEVRWLQSGKIVCNDHMPIYSGHKKYRKHGVGLLLSKVVSKSVLGYCALSDRILLVRIHGKPFNLSIIQVYALTSASSEEEIEDFYSDLGDAYKKCGNQDIVLVMGDLNVKVGGEQDALQEIVGQHGLGERNDRGDLWVDWCATHEQVIMNTWFQHHQRYLFTWKSPGDGVRNQIDYITTNKRFFNAITQVKGYPGANCGSDHVPIVATMKVKVMTLKRKKEDVKLQLDLLTADNEYSRQYNQKVSERMTGINAIDDIEARYQHFRETLRESAQQVLPEVERTARQKWMTAPILQKMEQRRLAKGNVAL